MIAIATMIASATTTVTAGVTVTATGAAARILGMSRWS